jgi:hypothetical protein
MRTATIRVMISDNVLDDQDHSEFLVSISNNTVVGISPINQGVYLGHSLIGKTIEELAEWSMPCEEHNHPMTYSEIYDPFLKKYRDGWTSEEIKDILEY